MKIGKQARLVFKVVGCGHCLAHAVYGFSQSALAVQHHGYDGGDTEEHDDALYEVVDGGGLVSTEDYVDGGEQCHDDGAVFIWNAESHFKKF